MLGEIALALSERKVNIRAVNSWIEGNEAVVRLVVDQVGVAKKALAARGWQAEEQEILEVELADKPGALAALAGALGQAGVNITHAYGGTGGARKASVFLAVSDLKAALKAAR
jgi:hypothetical protein